MSRVQVLLVDPDTRRRQSLRTGLLQAWSGASVLFTSAAEDTLRALGEFRPDVVLLDAEVDAMPEIRSISEVPVLVLADSNAEADQIQALRSGADDYLARPISSGVLSARIEAVLRRGRIVVRSGGQPDLVLGGLALWFRQQEVTIEGTPLRLTPLEFQLLWYLAQDVGEVIPSHVLLDQIWGSGYGATTKYLKVFVNRLRSKLASRGYSGVIETKRGVGYRLVVGGT